MSSENNSVEELFDAELILKVLDAEFKSNSLISNIHFDEFCEDSEEVYPY